MTYTSINFSDRYTNQQLNENAYKAVYLYVILTPILWMLGILIPIGAVIILYLFIRIMSKSIILDKMLIIWWFVALMQAIAVFINWVETDHNIGFLIYKLSSSTVTGWFFLGVTLSIGKYYNFYSKRLSRIATILGLYFVIFSLLSVILGQFLKLESLEIITPIGQILPNELPAVNNLFTMRFFIMEPFINIVLPRLILFYPWSVCLGFAGIGIFFLSINEEKTFWKIIGTFGGLLAIVLSMSRAAIIAFLLAYIFHFWLRLNNGIRWLNVAIISILFSLSLLSNFSFIDITNDFYEKVTELRAGSSEAREMGYEESWSGFIESPYWGNGWPGENISDNIPMPIGSHSSFYGLLYTGGIMVFIPFCIAFVLTLTQLFFRATKGTSFQKSAFVIIFSLGLLSYGEGIYSFILPNIFIFCCIGHAFIQRKPYYNNYTI